jgi:hypothetical protein
MSGELHFPMTALWFAAIGVGLALGLSWFWRTGEARVAVLPPVNILDTRMAEVPDRTVWLFVELEP